VRSKKVDGEKVGGLGYDADKQAGLMKKAGAVPYHSKTDSSDKPVKVISRLAKGKTDP
jgi:hypothetical protein